MSGLQRSTSRARDAVIGFGILGVGSVVLSLTLGWPFAVGWVLTVVGYAVYLIVKARRADQHAPTSNPTSGSSDGV
jgi:hypothetical protein